MLKGANPNAFDRWNNSILSHCLIMNDTENMCKMIKLLAKYGADVNLEFGSDEFVYAGIYYLYTFNIGKIRPLEYAKKKKLPQEIIDCLIELGAK